MDTHNDVAKAGKLPRRRPATRRTSSVPVGHVTSTSTAHGHKQKLVVANHTMKPENLPGHLQAGKVYLLDGRQRDRTTMEVAVADLLHQAHRDGLHVAAYGELH